jgi:hypothetical protein
MGEATAYVMRLDRQHHFRLTSKPSIAEQFRSRGRASRQRRMATRRPDIASDRRDLHDSAYPHRSAGIGDMPAQ